MVRVVLTKCGLRVGTVEFHGVTRKQGETVRQSTAPYFYDCDPPGCVPEGEALWIAARIADGHGEGEWVGGYWRLAG